MAIIYEPSSSCLAATAFGSSWTATVWRRVASGQPVVEDLTLLTSQQSLGTKPFLLLARYFQIYLYSSVTESYGRYS